MAQIEAGRKLGIALCATVIAAPGCEGLREVIDNARSSVPEEPAVSSATLAAAPVAAMSTAAAVSKPETIPSGYALVPRSTTLHQKPSVDSVSFKVEPGDTDDREPRVFRVVGHEGSWVALQNVGAEALEKHCVPGWGDLVAYRLRFWVPEDQLLEVTNRPVLEEFEDGSSAMLAAGTPVLHSETLTDATARADVLVGGEVLAGMELESSSVGHYYEPGPHFEPAPPALAAPYASGLVLGGELALPTLGLNGPAGGYDVYDAKQVDGGAVVTVGTPCAEFRAMADAMPSGLPPAAEEPVLAENLDDGPASAAPKWKVAADTQVFWADGEPAGQVIVPQVFDEDPREHDDKRCFSVDPPAVELCFPADGLAALEGGVLVAAADAPEGQAAPAEPARASAVVRTPAPKADAPAPAEAEPPAAEPTPAAPVEVVAAPEPPAAPAEPKVAAMAVAPEADQAEGGDKPSVNFGSPSVNGSLGSKEVRRSIANKLGGVRKCYEEGLERSPGLAGGMRVNFIVRPTGQVSKVTIAGSSLADREVEGCVARSVRRWTFPKPARGGLAYVRAPFVFKPGAQ